MWPNKERLREKKTYTNTAEAKKEEKKNQRYINHSYQFVSNLIVIRWNYGRNTKSNALKMPRKFEFHRTEFDHLELHTRIGCVMMQ